MCLWSSTPTPTEEPWSESVPGGDRESCQLPNHGRERERERERGIQQNTPATSRIGKIQKIITFFDNIMDSVHCTVSEVALYFIHIRNGLKERFS
jgi:hypothetical protein